MIALWLASLAHKVLSLILSRVIKRDERRASHAVNFGPREAYFFGADVAGLQYCTT